MAMMGVTWRMTAKGKSARSNHFHCEKRIASKDPPAAAAAKAANVVFSVTQSEAKSVARSVMSVFATRLGAGKTKGGMCLSLTIASHARMKLAKGAASAP
jgi:hypothetical protein